MDKEQAYLKFANEVTEAVSMEHRLDAEAFDHYLQFVKKVWRTQASASAREAIEPEVVTAVLAEALRKDIEDGIPEQIRDLVYGDLIRATLAHVDWPSLAECLLRHLATEDPLHEDTDYQRLIGNSFDDSEERDDFTGGCPTCHKTNGYLNVYRAHFFICHEHKVRWLRGENLFSSWRQQSRAHWRENWRIIKDYAEVDPWYPAPCEEDKQK
jgi:hypothetical protein